MFGQPLPGAARVRRGDDAGGFHRVGVALALADVDRVPLLYAGEHEWQTVERTLRVRDSRLVGTGQERQTARLGREAPHLEQLAARGIVVRVGGGLAARLRVVAVAVGEQVSRLEPER